MLHDRGEAVKIPFDPEAESMYCSRDGIKLVPSGHMFSEFMMCPRHGEFTIAPVIMREPEFIMGGEPLFKMEPNPASDKGKWFIHADQQFESMWNSCKALDRRHADGSPYDPRESRVL